MRAAAIHPPIARAARRDLTICLAGGTLVPPRQDPRRPVAAFLFLVFIVLLIGGPMAWQVMS